MTAPDRSESTAPSSTASCAVGVDVSKASLEVVFLGPEEEKSRSTSRSVSNTEEGFDELLDWVGQQTEANQEVHVCLEASGGYEQAVARRL